MRLPLFLAGAAASGAAVGAFWAVFAVWVVSELYIGQHYQLTAGATRRDRGSQIALIASVWIGIGLGFNASALVPGAAFRTGRDAIFISGLILMLLGLALRWYAIRVLGRSFTVTVGTSTDQQVVERGPYRYVRHPSYTGTLLTIAGVLLCCTNALALLAFLVPVAGYAYRIHTEELALADDIGEPYRAYMRRTRRLIPFVL